MKTETLEAWVIHKWPSGNTSSEVTFFTREQGILRCLCKGGRSPKKQALLQAFTPLCLVMDIRKERYYVRQIESVAGAFTLKSSALFAGLYINELVYYALRMGDPSDNFFDIYCQSLQELVAIKDQFAIERILRRLEWALLQICGYAISFTEEAQLKIPISPNHYYQFIPDEGFVITSKGLLGRDVLALAKDELDDLETLKAAKLIMRRAIDYLLEGRQLKSRALYINSESL
jgi:DNA repair protein RecO (recombination protein O)